MYDDIRGEQLLGLGAKLDLDFAIAESRDRLHLDHWFRPWFSVYYNSYISAVETEALVPLFQASASKRVTLHPPRPRDKLPAPGGQTPGPTPGPALGSAEPCISLVS
ncbi:hypothetical protein M8818_001447 [Zalaria obscura]|uniref:Uncharacterized protein n=1 Tax=Zalaria obscura TaxID=2024903 RepID=A0ACC3SKG2_9PEZI